MTRNGHSVDYAVQQVCAEKKWFQYARKSVAYANTHGVP